MDAVVVTYWRLPPLVCTDTMADRGLTWLLSASTGTGQWYMAALRARGFTASPYLALTPPHFIAANPGTQESGIATGFPPNLLIHSSCLVSDDTPTWRHRHTPCPGESLCIEGPRLALRPGQSQLCPPHQTVCQALAPSHGAAMLHLCPGH